MHKRCSVKRRRSSLRTPQAPYVDAFRIPPDLKKVATIKHRESLREIQVPTKIVGGRTDPLVPFTLVQDQHGMVADSTLTMLWGGHGLFLE